MINSWKMRWAGCVARKEKRGKMYTMILEKIGRKSESKYYTGHFKHLNKTL